MSQRHKDAINIQDGACNPSGIARSLVIACRECLDEGVDQRKDAAVRLIVHQLAYLCDIPAIDNGGASYSLLIEQCRAGAPFDTPPPFGNRHVELGFNNMVNADEVHRFEQWARDNWLPDLVTRSDWHPLVRMEWTRISLHYGTLEQMRVRRDDEGDGLWLVELFSKASQKWLPQGEHYSKESAEKDLRSWVVGDLTRKAA